MSETEEAQNPFDFDTHGRTATEAYEHIRPLYESYAHDLQGVVQEALSVANIKVASVEARAKTLDSFRVKASQPSENDPAGLPQYLDPLKQITDLAGIRIITFFPKDVETVSQVLRNEFEILEESDKGESLVQDERFGYQSIHYLVCLKPNRTALPEYSRFRDRVAEIQLRTVLQHAWAEIEHDIQYKSTETIPPPIRRRFMSLAGMLEIADREFQAIQDDDDARRQAARDAVATGELEDVEITPDALKAYLDNKLGPDGRVSAWSYEWTARLLLRLGFKNFRQIDECIGSYDDDKISRTLWGTRQGQTSRFEDCLMAGLGERFLIGHPWEQTEWYPDAVRRRLINLSKAGILIGGYAHSATPVAI